MKSEHDLLNAIAGTGGDPADLPFWEGCRNGLFLLHRCNICSRYYWPASRCVEHGDRDMQWVQSSGRGELYTYTVMHRVLAPAFKEKAPYVVAVIKLDEGPFFHSNVVDCDIAALGVGMRLDSTMVEHDSGLTIPMFRPMRQA